jgi:hypothetical protein
MHMATPVTDAPGARDLTISCPGGHFQDCRSCSNFCSALRNKPHSAAFRAAGSLAAWAASSAASRFSNN